ncbi:aminotransferase [Rhizocola hellebori]|uniref:Aminotransferase n=1 Tax=Rhizocola hellebori TaxID=1392758 RepID=A0A8J3QJM5_9ACTN|nr:PLP-dependent aminotransferase family protein [Rhizocola hellebori]GIH10955.1 aminotransferase [Rhizocola hellebori]
MRPLSIEELSPFLSSPDADAMNFLNEIALRFPDAISFAAGRPYDEFFSSELIHRYLDTYRAHLLAESGDDEVHVRRMLLQYGRTKGIINDLIAKSLLVDEDIDVDPESIVVTVGAQEALYLVLRALRRTDHDVVLSVQPAYVGFSGAAQLADMQVLPVSSAPEGVRLSDVRAILRQSRAAGLNPRALYLNTDFANPTGRSLDIATRHRLLRLAEDEQILLIEDNPYGVFSGDRESVPTLKALDGSGQVVYVGSFAKTVFPGARVGYVVADQRVVAAGRTELLADHLAKLKSVLTVNTSPIGQAVIAGKLLENGLSMRAANKREIEVYQRNMRLVLNGLAAAFPKGESPDVSWNVPGGGFFLLLDVPFETGDDVLERSARDHAVLWTPIHHFYGDGRPRKQMRLSFSHLSPAEIHEGLGRLADFIRA